MSGGSLRLFVGVPVPAAAVAVAVATAAAGDLLALPGARVVPDGTHHVTLRFLGAVPEGELGHLLAPIAAACTDVRVTTARLVGLGIFPGARRRARVLWAGVEDGGAMARIAEGLRPLPGEPPPDPFVAHCTLARFDPPADLGELPEGPLGDGFPADRVVLYRSRPGSAYEPLEIFPLGR